MTDTEINYFLKKLPSSNDVLDNLSQAFDKTYSKELASLSSFMILPNREQYIEPTHTTPRATWHLHKRLQSIDTNTLKSNF